MTRGIVRLPSNIFAVVSSCVRFALFFFLFLFFSIFNTRKRLTKHFDSIAESLASDRCDERCERESPFIYRDENGFAFLKYRLGLAPIVDRVVTYASKSTK